MSTASAAVGPRPGPRRTGRLRHPGRPAAPACTFATSAVGAGTYALPSPASTGSITPDRSRGLACGQGGLLGGCLGARLQPRLPEVLLRLLLGTLATALGVLYALDALR
ncbi:hypothetical protein [Streptomyces antibioticus]|uniref:hypothetical protein n=1 Tax=Streptomyces antibioticus TaxID=1890 RepID=UPI003F4CAEDF